MTTLSVPLSSEQEEFIKMEVKMGRAANKADVVRKALAKWEEEQLIQDVLQAEREIAEGKVFYGDLRKIAKRLKNK